MSEPERKPPESAAREFFGCYSDTRPEGEDHHEVCQEFLNYSGDIPGCVALTALLTALVREAVEECAREVERFDYGHPATAAKDLFARKIAAALRALVAPGLGRDRQAQTSRSAPSRSEGGA